MKSVLFPFVILLTALWAWQVGQIEDLLNMNKQLVLSLGLANEALAFAGSRLQDANEQVAEASEVMIAASAVLNACRHGDAEVDPAPEVVRTIQ